jgi:beta-lactamase superfamily II metal-dependent hydrolase
MSISSVIISHSDADHLGNAARILEAYSVKQVVHTGYETDNDSWKAANDAITAEGGGGAKLLNLREEAIEPGTVWETGPAKVTFVTGLHKRTDSDLCPTPRAVTQSALLRAWSSRVDPPDRGHDRSAPEGP